VLIGDAGHAITPFFGQGTNSGFESVVVLTNRMRRHSNDIARAFREYTSRRKADADAIARMALENFVEMREKVGDETFLRRKKIENALENRFPTRFRSRYSMVCYGGAGGTYF
jgi:kynurenine 3-monooxygenase